MTFRDTPQDTETPPTGPFGVPPEYFGPPDGETALRADEMQANRIETQAMGALRTALHHPETGFASRPPTERLAALPEIQATLDGIGETFRAQATTPRQRAILGPLLDNHLEHAATQVGRLAEQALAEADDGIVESRIGSLQQDAAVNWDDPARLRILGRAVVTERRSQGDRRGWDKTETETRGRQNASDFYATAIEAGIDKDIDRAGKLLTDAQGVLLPERQALLARKLAEAREAKHVAGIAGTLAAIPLDPATPPQPETYRARAEELTPDDAAPELRARIAQLADTAQRHATKYWQHDRNQAGLAAIDWMVSNPGAPVVTMDRKIATQLSPDQRARLQEIETTGRLDSDPAVYDKLDRLAVYDPKTFAATDLSQYRLDLDGKDYARFTAFQKGDIAFARYDRGRTVLDAGLIKAQLDPDGPEARAARGELDKTLRSFETIEGRPPTMADIDRVAGDILGRIGASTYDPTASVGDPNIVRVGTDPDDIQVAQGGVPQQKSRPAQQSPTQPRKLTLEELDQIRDPRTYKTEERRTGALNQFVIKERGEKWDDMIRQLPPEIVPGNKIQAPLPPDWREGVRKIDPSYVGFTEAAAKKYGIPLELLARLLGKESNYDKHAGTEIKRETGQRGPKKDAAIGIPQMRKGALEEFGYTPETFTHASPETQINVGAAYLAKQYRFFQDWPKAAGAYHSGATRLSNWLKGYEADFESIPQRIAADSRKRLTTGVPPRPVSDEVDKQVRQKRAKDEIDQWKELKGYFPYIFLGDPTRYDGPNNPR